MQLENPLKKQVRISLWIALVGCLIIVYSLFFPLRNENLLVMIGGIVVLLIGLIAAFDRRWMAKRRERELIAISKGDFLVHWQISPDRWNDFCRSQWASQEEERLDDRKYVLFAGIFIGCLVILVLSLFAEGHWNLPSVAIVFLLSIVPFYLLFELSFKIRKGHLKLTKAPVDVVWRQKSVFWQDQFVTWGYFGSWLEKLELVDNKVKFVVCGQGEHSRREMEYYLPLPDEQEFDFEQFQRTIRA